LYEGRIYFERNGGSKYDIYFGRHIAWLTYFTYHCDESQEGKSRLADSEIGLELDTLEFDASS
jgi:hypothetical protein